MKKSRENSRFVIGCCLGSIVGSLIIVAVVSFALMFIIIDEGWLAEKRAGADRSLKELIESFGQPASRDHESQIGESPAEPLFLKNAKPVDMGLYAEWMRDWLLAGNELDPMWGFMSRPNPEDFFYQISDGAVITPLFGADSVLLIAPKGTKFRIIDLGHNGIFYWDTLGNARFEGSGFPFLSEEVVRRLEQMNDPKLTEALERNMEKVRRYKDSYPYNQ